MISLKDITSGWNRFFFEPVSPLPIAVYRILFGLGVIANHVLLMPDLHAWFSDRGTISFATGGRLVGGAGLSLFAVLPPTAFWMWFVWALSFVTALLVTIGLFTRTSSIVLFLTLVTLHHRNPVILNSGDTWFRIAGFFLMFSQAGAALSVDRLVRIARGKESGAPEARVPWAMRMIQLQLAFLYFHAFVWKAIGPMWLSGTAVYYTSRLSEFWRFPVPYVFEHMWTIKIWTWATLVVEFALGTLVWVKELRYWVLLAGLLMHLGIDYSMNIQLFAFVMVSAYVLFVAPEHLERAFAWMRAKWNAMTGFGTGRQAIPVLYDGNCSFCTRSVEVLKRTDVLHRLEFVNMHDPETKVRFPDFDPERGEREMLVRAKQGWLGGFFAFRHIARHLPVMWLILPPLYFKPVAIAGDRIYKRIAARRYCILKPRQYAQTS